MASALLAPFFICLGQTADPAIVGVLQGLRSAIEAHDRHAVEEQRGELLRLAPQNREAHGTAGQWLVEGRYCAPAREEFKLASSLGASQKQQAGSHYLLGRCYERVSQAGDALAAYREAIASEPGEEKFHLALISLLASEWETGPGEDAAREALTRFPNSARIWAAVGLVELKNGSLGNTLEAWRKANSLEPDSPLATKLLGRIQMAQARYAEAVQTFQKAIELDRSDAQPWFYEGLAYLKIDQSDRALEAFLRAIELNPEPPEAYYWAGSITLQRKHQNEQAIRYLEQAVARAPSWGPANQVLIQAYRAAGQGEKATHLARRFREVRQTEQAASPTVLH